MGRVSHGHEAHEQRVVEMKNALLLLLSLGWWWFFFLCPRGRETGWGGGTAEYLRRVYLVYLTWPHNRASCVLLVKAWRLFGPSLLQSAPGCPPVLHHAPLNVFFFFYPGSIRHRKQKSSVRLSYSLKLLAASCRPVSSGQVITCLRKHKMPKCPWDVGKNMSKVQRFIFNVLSNFCCCFFIPGICYTFWKLSVDCTHGW